MHTVKILSIIKDHESLIAALIESAVYLTLLPTTLQNIPLFVPVCEEANGFLSFQGQSVFLLKVIAVDVLYVRCVFDEF